MKLYEVIFQDEYNNLTLLGYFKDLKEAVPLVNEYLKSYGEGCQIKEDNLVEYASTFSYVFDLDIGSLFPENDEVSGLQIRGFILDSDEVAREISRLVKEK